jgi:hypothetical protein
MDKYVNLKVNKISKIVSLLGSEVMASNSGTVIGFKRVDTLWPTVALLTPLTICRKETHIERRKGRLLHRLWNKSIRNPGKSINE